jgi:hypothetical protein
VKNKFSRQEIIFPPQEISVFTAGDFSPPTKKNLKMKNNLLKSAALVAMLFVASCSKDDNGEPIIPPIDEILGDYNIKVENLVVNGLKSDGQAVAYLKSFEKSFSKESTKDAETEEAKAEQILEAAKVEFTSVKNGFDQNSLDTKAKGDLNVSSEPVEMKAENINVTGEISADITLYAKDGTKIGETFHVSANPSDKRGDFVLTIDFKNATLIADKMVDSTSAFATRINNFKSTNSLANANVKMLWKNLTIDAYGDSKEAKRTALLEYIMSSKSTVTYNNVLCNLGVGPFADLDALQDFYNTTGLRTTSAGVWNVVYTGAQEKTVSVKKWVDAKISDPNLIIRFTDENDKFKWDFTGVSLVTPTLLQNLAAVMPMPIGYAFKVSSSSPQVNVSGDFSTIAINNIVGVWANSTFYSPNFKEASPGAVTLETTPVIPPMIPIWYAKYRALKGVKHANDTYTN